MSPRYQVRHDGAVWYAGPSLKRARSVFEASPDAEFVVGAFVIARRVKGARERMMPVRA